jgi:hypothetical protein
MVECVLAKDEIRVRFPVAALEKKTRLTGLFLI